MQIIFQLLNTSPCERHRKENDTSDFTLHNTSHLKKGCPVLLCAVTQDTEGLAEMCSSVVLQSKVHVILSLTCKKT